MSSMQLTDPIELPDIRAVLPRDATSAPAAADAEPDAVLAAWCERVAPLLAPYDPEDRAFVTELIRKHLKLLVAVTLASPGAAPCSIELDAIVRMRLSVELTSRCNEMTERSHALSVAAFERLSLDQGLEMLKQYLDTTPRRERDMDAVWRVRAVLAKKQEQEWAVCPPIVRDIKQPVWSK